MNDPHVASVPQNCNKPLNPRLRRELWPLLDRRRRVLYLLAGGLRRSGAPPEAIREHANVVSELAGELRALDRRIRQIEKA